jgi:acetylglutamate kinase
MESNWILIAKGGYLKGIKVEEISISDEELEDFLEEEFDSFDEYEEYVLEEAAAAYEQGFSSVMILKKEEAGALIKELSKITKK